MKRLDFEQWFAREFELEVESTDPSGLEVLSGRMRERRGRGRTIEIDGGVPRFVSAENYAANFGLQWNEFRSTQLDSKTGLSLSGDRFWRGTGWTPNALAGKRVLEVGSGAGRFTEILLGAGARVVSVDYSSAIDANVMNNGTGGDVCFVQADIYDLPFEDGAFDYVFCYGVLQHVPDPDRAYLCLFKKLKPGGMISIDFYRKFRLPNVWATPKYLWRPFVKKLPPEKLLKLVRGYIPWWFPIDNAIRSIPKIGPRLLAFVPIPCWNYLGTGLSYEQRKEWAILDTFDALGAAYDEPRTLDQVARMVSCADNAWASVFYGGNGIVANVRRKE